MNDGIHVIIFMQYSNFESLCVMLIICTGLDYYSATVSNYQVFYRFINYQYSHNLANMFVNGYTDERIKKRL